VEIVGADGVPYERRNRVALCRCGASDNKPFCDGAHAEIGFRDDGGDVREGDDVGSEPAAGG
jgi:CDGSH-type Zn-finger protein